MLMRELAMSELIVRNTSGYILSVDTSEKVNEMLMRMLAISVAIMSGNDDDVGNISSNDGSKDSKHCLLFMRLGLKKIEEMHCSHVARNVVETDKWQKRIGNRKSISNV